MGRKGLSGWSDDDDDDDVSPLRARVSSSAARAHTHAARLGVCGCECPEMGSVGCTAFAASPELASPRLASSPSD
jgi:hypothetical protein